MPAPASGPRAAEGKGGTFRRPAVALESVQARVFTIPTDAPEADGTLSWSATTLVLVQAQAGGCTGLGFTYAHAAAAALVTSVLSEAVAGGDALAPTAAWERMRATVRNAGYPGVASCAIAAVDIALWDLKARLLGLPLAALLGPVRSAVPIYGSGGFTSYSDRELARQLGDWVAAGIPRVKMKVGSEPERDPERVRVARAAIGDDAALFTDANGAYQRKRALELAEVFRADAGVSWFEEPVSSDDLEGLRLLRNRAPAGMEIAAGEYGYDIFYFRRMLDEEAVDVLQADVTRCGGITPMLQVAALCSSRAMPLSAHTSPSIHAHVGAALAPLVHIEYFHDHVRIERMLFDGVLDPAGGELAYDPGRPGLGLDLRDADARRFEH